MKKLLKPLLLSLGGALLMGTFCCNAGAIKIEVPVIDPNPHIGDVLTCNNCNSIAVKIIENTLECIEDSCTFDIEFLDSKQAGGSLQCTDYFREYADEGEEPLDYWRSNANKEFIIPLNRIPNDILNKFISLTSAFQTTRLIQDSCSECTDYYGDLAQRQIEILRIRPDYEEYLNTLSDEYEESEDKIMDDIFEYLEGYIKQLNANQLG